VAKKHVPADHKRIPDGGNTPGSKWIGKYVVYDQADGGSCFGRIVDEAMVNTMQGEKEVFILDDRVVRYLRSTDLKRFRVFYPNVIDAPHLRSAGTVDADGKFREGKEGMFMEARKVRGVTTLRKDMIDLDRDVVDVEEMTRRVEERLGKVDSDTLFMALLEGRKEIGDDEVVEGEDALDLGMRTLLGQGKMIGVVKAELARKLKKLDNQTDDGGDDDGD